MTIKNETYQYLLKKIDEIATIVSLEKNKDKQKWAEANFEYGNIALLLAEENKELFSRDMYENAISAFKNSLKVYNSTKDITSIYNVTLALTKSLRFYGVRTGTELGRSYLTQAENLLEELAHKLRTNNLYSELADLYCEQANLARDFIQISHPSTYGIFLNKAKKFYDRALKVLTIKEDFENWIQVTFLQSSVLLELSYFHKPPKSKLFLNKASKLLKAILQYIAMVEPHDASTLLNTQKITAIFEIGFIYDSLAQQTKGRKSDTYTKKALKYLTLLKEADLAKLNNEAIIKLNLKKANLLYNIASKQKNIDKKISNLKSSIELHKTNLIILKETNATALIALTYSYLSNIYDNLAFFSKTHADKIKFYGIAIDMMQKAFLDKFLASPIKLANIMFTLAKITHEPNKIVLLEEAKSLYKKALIKDANETERYQIHKDLVKIYLMLAESNKDKAKRYFYNSIIHSKNALRYVKFRSAAHYTLLVRILCNISKLANYDNLVPSYIKHFRFFYTKLKNLSPNKRCNAIAIIEEANLYNAYAKTAPFKESIAYLIKAKTNYRYIAKNYPFYHSKIHKNLLTGSRSISITDITKKLIIKFWMITHK